MIFICRNNYLQARIYVLNSRYSTLQMPTSFDVPLKLWVVMNRAARAIEGRLRPQVEAHGLSLTEFGVLEALLHKGTLPIGALGDLVLLTSGSMTYVVDKLEQRGLIERQACPTDRRVVHAALTDAGRGLIEAVFAEHAALLHEVMTGLTADEQVLATDLMRRLGLHARQAVSAP